MATFTLSSSKVSIGGEICTRTKNKIKVLFAHVMVCPCAEPWSSVVKCTLLRAIQLPRPRKFSEGRFHEVKSVT